MPSNLLTVVEHVSWSVLFYSTLQYHAFQMHCHTVRFKVALQTFHASKPHHGVTGEKAMLYIPSIKEGICSVYPFSSQEMPPIIEDKLSVISQLISEKKLLDQLNNQMYAIKCMRQFLWQMLGVIHYRQMPNRIKTIVVQSMCTARVPCWEI